LLVNFDGIEGASTAAGAAKKGEEDQEKMWLTNAVNASDPMHQEEQTRLLFRHSLCRS
jgi:hypothetical protein